MCDSSGVAQFGDVGEGDYGADYILCMRALGLSVGTGGGDYGPDLQLTRAQMASFLVRLWRDVLNKDCPSGGTPFTDVAGSVHEENIACLYNLEITKGKTDTTYEPGSDLTASQISRFLLRTYEKAGRSCDDRASELDEAVGCLHALRVLPTVEEGRGSHAVIRAQMAVYVISLWHNLAGRGTPPIPPTLLSDSASVDVSGPLPTVPSSDMLPGVRGNAAPLRIEGHWIVPVFVCGPEGKYTANDVRDLTTLLNDKLNGFFGRSSSQRMSLEFADGAAVSADQGWDEVENIPKIQARLPRQRTSKIVHTPVSSLD